ncbi:hypothetical protein FGG08_001743 [Glutinoglossum americanum]|uniref:RRM domain-containing protein n=1 Tax=Glutinoglossum americanum TaxID=1670608 RepID=A0A9P8IAI6_9PEZI|nr:hypothetical protein FGG08_001743 [Glutinoglossum americanum]
MNSTSHQEPEFRGKTLTPISPRPVHISQPSNIPVLQNQMDPVLNDTSTYLGQNGSSNVVNVPLGSDHARSSSESSSTFMEHDGGIESGFPKEDNTQEGGDGNDDYAMSLEFDDDEGMDNQDSTATTMNESPPTTATFSSSLPLSHQTNPNSHTNELSLANIDTNQPTQNSYLATAPHTAKTEATSTPTQYQTKADEAADVSNGGVNFQTLLDNLSPSSVPASATENLVAPSTAHSAANPSFPRPGSIQSPASALSTHSTLPPRPPPQAKPATHPSYSPEDDIRSYHPHNNTPGTAAFSQPHQPNSYRPSHGLPPVIAAGAPGTSSLPGSGLPPPPVAVFQQPPPPGVQQQVPPSPIRNRQRERVHPRSVTSADDEEEEPWPPETAKKYEEFLHDEREYVSEGQWDKFPPNSRLFIGVAQLQRLLAKQKGNLPTEKVTKRDLFHVFHRHGKLAQISIKQAYGFVQFLNADSCVRALQAEQGQVVRGRKMHLEISKPQKNTRGPEAGGARSSFNRRSRSPDYERGGLSPRGGGGQAFRVGGTRFNGDRTDRAGGFDNRYGASGRDRDYRDKVRVRDDYRPARSPSPRGFRGRDEYRGGRDRDRSRDRYDGSRRHGRSRSRSPYGRGRYRSRSPRGREVDEDAGLPLPKRDPRDVPDVQILVMDELDRAFISFVEKAFRDRGIRSDVLFLNPRLDLAAVVRRQILEGVQAVSRLTRQTQSSGKIPMQVFDRRGGAGNVRYDEYDNLDPAVAAELVVRAKQTHGAPPVSNQYGLPAAQPYQAPAQYSQPFMPQVPQQQPAAGATGATPNLANLITSLDGPTLQKLLGALQQQPSSAQPQIQHQQQSPTGLPADFTSLLGAGSRPQQQQPFQPQAGNPYTALASNPVFTGNPAFASLIASAGNRAPQPSVHQPQQNQPASQVHNLLDQIAKWQNK